MQQVILLLKAAESSGVADWRRAPTLVWEVMELIKSNQSLTKLVHVTIFTDALHY